MARGVPHTPTQAHLGARIAGLSRSVRNGERPADDPELDNCRRDLAALRLAASIRETVDNWPRLTDEQIDGIVVLLRAGRAS